tara:strand:- start:789 stop:1022 length:234 start_codon:yes stop_codon:yes gene_type:complete
MPLPFKKIIFQVFYNFSLFLLLMVGIQNSSNKIKVNFISAETIELPLSFVIGLSFIGGSITGSFIDLSSLKKKDKNL